MQVLRVLIYLLSLILVICRSIYLSTYFSFIHLFTHLYLFTNIYFIFYIFIFFASSFRVIYVLGDAFFDRHSVLILTFYVVRRIKTMKEKNESMRLSHRKSQSRRVEYMKNISPLFVCQSDPVVNVIQPDAFFATLLGTFSSSLI